MSSSIIADIFFMQLFITFHLNYKHREHSFSLLPTIMKQIFLILIICLIFCFLPSCDKAERRESPMIIIENIDTVMFDEIAVFERIVNDGKHLYGISSRTDSTLFVYSLPELTFITCGLPKGQGPNEVQYGPLPANSNTTGVWLLGFTPGELRRFECLDDTIAVVDTTYFGRIVTVNDLTILENEVALFNEFPACCEIQRMTADGSSSESFTYSREPVTGSNSRNRASFASNGKIAAIVFSYIDKIIFLDPATLKVVKTFGEGSPLNPNAIGALPFYSVAKASPNGIYVQKVVSENEAVIEVYDNDGSPIRQLQLPIVSNTFTVDERNKFLILYNDNQPDRFFKVKI